MPREISAGGLVVRPVRDGWELAVIEPQREAAQALVALKAKKPSHKMLLALPKGLVDSGETAEQAAVREVMEETGLTAIPIAKLGTIKYVYSRSWGDNQRVFKIVTFFLFRYQFGVIGEIGEEMRVEVKRALWIPLEAAAAKLAYRGERDMVEAAQQFLEANPEAYRDAAKTAH
jgi:8-oxo-dGTP pyrophosphatase MutT (NUDIX family)